jgi:predicted dehydrogenase
MARRRGVVRYAVVGLGHIAQVAVLPAFTHATRNSRLVAVVSGDRTKRRDAAARYGVETYSYDDYERCLEQVDAVYVATPNHLHAEHTIRAARAGVHVLCEKPLAVTTAECRRMIAACDRHGVRLMTAYRLHFEAINLRAIDLLRDGRIGEPKYFNSSFSMRVRAGNIRTKRDFGGGTLYDIGVYCINAARYLFRAEPTQVTAVSVNSGVAALKEIDESTAAVLRFGDDRIATFVTSFNAFGVGEYRVVGTEGELHVDPAFEYKEGLAYTLTVGERTERKRIGKRDQFAAQLLYFSDCILERRTPEPSGEEGLQDVRIIEALYRSARTGKAVTIPPFAKTVRPTGRQKITKPGIRKPRTVKVRSASRE